MNISTYEARIKALEDQLNPPGPAGGLVIESITISPDVAGINAILEEMTFDYESGDPDRLIPWARNFRVTRSTTDTLPQTLDVTIAPTEGLYAMFNDTITGTTSYGEISAPATFTFTRETGPELTLRLGAINTNDMRTATYGVLVTIIITKTAD